MTHKELKKQYGRSIVFWTIAYTIIILSLAFVFKLNHNLNLAIKWILAFLPSIPIAGTIYSILNFWQKCDEFLKSRMANHFIKSIGVLLFIITAWGFEENYASAPRLDLIWTYPMFWLIYAFFALFKVAKEERICP